MFHMGNVCYQSSKNWALPKIKNGYTGSCFPLCAPREQKERQAGILISTHITHT